MNKQIKIHVLRVFTNENGDFGNPVGIILDYKNEITQQQRQAIATKLGFSESVFIDNLESATVTIYNPKKEVAFAGHALVGTAHYCNSLLGKPIKQIKCKAGIVNTTLEGDKTWINASLVGTPPWLFEELDGPDEVDDLTFGQKKKYKHTVVWSWIDKNHRIIRARTFAPDWGIPEDEANGSGSMQLATRLRREVEVRHGKGSIIYARPMGEDFAYVGGRVVEDRPQEMEVK